MKFYFLSVYTEKRTKLFGSNISQFAARSLDNSTHNDHFSLKYEILRMLNCS